MDERIRLPNISAGTPEGKIEQIKSYLQQLALQLDRILETGGAGGVSVQQEDAQTMFSRILPMIMQSREIVDSIKSKLQNSFADMKDIENYVGKWLQPELVGGVVGGVILGITEDESFIPIVSYRPNMVVLYQEGEEVMRFERGTLSVEGDVWANRINGVYMRPAKRGSDGKIRIKTMFEEFNVAGANQTFFIFGDEGGMQFFDVLMVTGEGEINNSHLAFVSAENGYVVISDNIGQCVIFSTNEFYV